MEIVCILKMREKPENPSNKNFRKHLENHPDLAHLTPFAVFEKGTFKIVSEIVYCRK